MGNYSAKWSRYDMKTAIFIKDGTTQLVLTPETDWEKKVVDGIKGDCDKATIMRGEFYECQGGWYRESAGQTSLIIRLDEAT